MFPIIASIVYGMKWTTINSRVVSPLYCEDCKPDRGHHHTLLLPSRKINKTVSGKGFSQVFMLLAALQPGRHTYSRLNYEDLSSILET